MDVPHASFPPAPAAPAGDRPGTAPGSLRRRLVEEHTARLMDSAMCAMMFAIQCRRRLRPGSRRLLEEYIDGCFGMSRAQYFHAPAIAEQSQPAAGRPAQILWSSPVGTPFARNNTVRADLFPCEQGWPAPMVLFLHALMSASDIGYRRWAAVFNRHGWNACFIHLPFHYSRTPPGCFNGELAITADLVRTAEGLRQGVSEVRQLMHLLRQWGCGDFGLWASSYGGWIGALLASVERDFRFVALLEPIVNVEHAIWTSPAGLSLRRQFVAHGIDQALIERHFPLTSPLHATPLTAPDRVLLVSGEYDRIAPASEIERLHRLWSGSSLESVAQGHFGYQMMPAAWRWLQSRGLIGPP